MEQETLQSVDHFDKILHGLEKAVVDLQGSRSLVKVHTTEVALLMNMERARDFLSDAIMREDPGRRFLRSSFAPETGRLARLLAVLEAMAFRDHIVSDQRLESCTRALRCVEQVLLDQGLCASSWKKISSLAVLSHEGTDHVVEHLELEHAPVGEEHFSRTMSSQASTEASKDLASDYSRSDVRDDTMVVVEETIVPLEKCLTRSKSEGSGAARIVGRDVLSLSVPATPAPRPSLHVSCLQAHRGALALAMSRGPVHQEHVIFQKCSTGVFGVDQLALCARKTRVPVASRRCVPEHRSRAPRASRISVSSRRGSSTTGEFKGACMLIASQAVGERYSTPLRRVRVPCPRSAHDRIHIVRVCPLLHAFPVQGFSVPCTVVHGLRAIASVAVAR